MKCSYLVFFALVSAPCVQCFFKETVEIQSPTGRIRGSVMYSRKGRKIYSFRGVRYAKPPVGNSRFQPAVPMESWEGVFDATKEGPSCPQPLLFLNPSEDCLRLNVYTTTTPKNGIMEGEKKPVMVFIHPGGFARFSGQSIIFGPRYIMDKDVVVITFNYRLSTLGFISTGDARAPGNLGLKDQVMVLRWVKKNIAAFGGDPDSVTIVGGSSGSRSVILHMVSPMSKGLFHRAVSMGGSPLAPGGLPTHQKYIIRKQAKIFNCPNGTIDDYIACLKAKPAVDFGRSVSQFAEWHELPILIWSPVVEPKIEGVEQFMPAQPEDLIRQGKFYQVPFICGVTQNEFDGLIIPFVKQLQGGDNSTIQDLNENWYKLAPINFVYERGTPWSRKISTYVRKSYFDDKPIDLNNIENLGHVYSDSYVMFRVHRAVQLLATYSEKPVYVYKFTHQGRRSLYMWNDTTPYGVSHQDDLQYIFNVRILIPGAGDATTAMVMLMTSMWSNFMSTGQPISANSSITDIVWDPYDPARDNYLDLNLHPIMKTGLYPKRVQIWETLFPLKPLPNEEEC